MHNLIFYPQGAASLEDFAIETKHASADHELRDLILRDRERVNRKALLGGMVCRVARSSGLILQRARKFEAKRDIGLQRLRAA